MAINIVKGKIGNALTSTAANHVVAVSQDIYDESVNKYQSEININLEDKINELGSIVTDPEYIKMILDKEGKILCGIKANGEFLWSKGIPRHLIDFVIKNINDITNKKVDKKVDKKDGYLLIAKEKESTINIDRENEELIYCITDNNGKILLSIGKDGHVHMPKQSLFDIICNEEYCLAVVDKTGKIICGINMAGEFVYHKGIQKQTLNYINKLAETQLSDAYIRNRDKEPMLYAASRYHYDGKTKDFQAEIISDSHTELLPIVNAVNCANGFKSIDAIIHCGDGQRWTPNEIDVKGDHIKNIMDTLSNSIKPFFYICGNHDVGIVPYLHFCRTHEEVYHDMVKPLVDRGILHSGEYNFNTGYYYHDFNETKTRLIVLYEYDMPLELEESNPYWEYVPYNPVYPKMEANHNYVYDPSSPIIVNCGGYKNHSFKLKATIKTIDDPAKDRTGKSMPRYKMRSCRILSLEQIEWLIDVLNNTPKDYNVLIATHQPVMRNVELTDNLFSIGGWSDNNNNPRKDGAAEDDLADSDIITELLHAFNTKTVFRKRVAFVDTDYCRLNGVTSEYLNKNNDSEGRFAYIVNADFTNAKAKFSCFVSGHDHLDMIEKKMYDNYNYYNIIVCSSSPYQTSSYPADITRIYDEKSIAYDNITTISLSDGRIALARIGNNKTIDGRDRSFEIINNK